MRSRDLACSGEGAGQAVSAAARVQRWAAFPRGSRLRAPPALRPLSVRSSARAERARSWLGSQTHSPRTRRPQTKKPARTRQRKCLQNKEEKPQLIGFPNGTERRLWFTPAHHPLCCVISQGFPEGRGSQNQRRADTWRQGRGGWALVPAQPLAQPGGMAHSSHPPAVP